MKTNNLPVVLYVLCLLLEELALLREKEMKTNQLYDPVKGFVIEI